VHVSEPDELASLAIHLYPRNHAALQARLRVDADKKLPIAEQRAPNLPEALVARGPYLPLLVEARELYVWGFDYGCVAMCGITAERITKDVLRAAVLVQQEGQVSTPPPVAFDQLERVEVSGLVRFLQHSGLVSKEVAEAAWQLLQLRNQYAHARGPAPAADAEKALAYLQTIVDGTVSIADRLEITSQSPFFGEE
jgi:hypothetical protein